MRKLLLLSTVSLIDVFAADDPSARRQLRPVPIQQVTISDTFWTPKRDVWQRVTIRRIHQIRE